MPAKPTTPSFPVLTDSNYTLDKHGIYIYDQSPSVPSGLAGACSMDYIQKWMVSTGWFHLWRNICSMRLIPAYSTVLDVACGYVEIGKLIYTQRKACAWVGMELLHKKLVKAQKLGWGNSPPMLLQRDIIKPFPFEAGVFDVVLSLETIEHVEKEHGIKFLNEICRVLRPGGLLILSTPNSKSKDKRNFEYHYHEYALDEIQETIAGSGLGEIHVYGIQLEGNIRVWDKEFEHDPLYQAAREAMLPSMVKAIWSFNRPQDSENLLITAKKPQGIPRTPVRRGTVL